MTGTQQALWRRWTRKRDPRAFEALVAQTQRFVFDFARRLTRHDADAEDLAQEAFLELAEAPADKPAAVGLKAFLGRRVVVGAKMLKRAALTRQRHERAAAVPEGLPSTSAPHADVEAALSLLDADDRHAVELRFLHDLSYAEVAHVLGVSEPAARMRVHRALKSLRERLGPHAEASLAALALFAPPPRFLSHVKAAALVGGTVVVGTALKKAVLVVLLIAVAGGGVYLARTDRAPAPRDTEIERTARTMPAPAPTTENVDRTDPAEAGDVARPGVAPRAPIPKGKGSVAGVVRFADGTPLAGATLQLSGSPAVPAETNAEGRFHIHGDWVAHRALLIVGENEFRFPLALVKMKPDEVVEIDVLLDPGDVVEGTVVNAATRNPVPGAEVRFSRPGSKGAGVVQGSWGLADTDAEGHFRFDYVPAGDYTIACDAEGLEPMTRELQVGPGIGPVELLMKPARPLVVRFENLPAAWRGAPVTLAFSARDLNVYREGKIDARGELHTHAPRPGPYIVSTLNGATPLPRLEKQVTLGDDATAEIVFVLPPGGGLSGTAPTEHTVLVKPADLRTRADAEGRFAFAYVPAGEQEVWVELGRAWRRGAVVRVPESGAVNDVALRFAGVTVRGRLNAPGDIWSKGIALRLAGKAEEIARADVDAHGDFAIPAVPPGEYDLDPWNTENLDGEPRRIRVGDTDLDLGEIVIEPSLEVPVVVAAPAGTKLAGEHWLSAQHEGEHRGMSVALDEHGHGRMRMQPGHWRFELVIGDLRSGPIELNVAPDPEPLHLRLR